MHKFLPSNKNFNIFYAQSHKYKIHFQTYRTMIKEMVEDSVLLMTNFKPFIGDLVNTIQGDYEYQHLRLATAIRRSEGHLCSPVIFS